MKLHVITIALIFNTLSTIAQKEIKVPASQIPFDGMDQTWLNGNDRRDSALLQTPYFTGGVMIDVNYSYSFANPIDHTVVGSTALARDAEIQLSSLNFGGDFYYKGARGRIMKIRRAAGRGRG